MIAVLTIVAAPIALANADCGASAQGGSSAIEINGYCPGEVDDGGNAVAPPVAAPITKTIVCGFSSSTDNGLNPGCGTMFRCPVGSVMATMVQQNNTWVLLNTFCAQDQPNAPPRRVPTAQDLREQVLRLLPEVRIGSAWTTKALVNAETIVWAETGRNRDLGTVTVVGRRVALRIGFDHANWNFGDGATDTTTDPGTPYSDSDPCGAAQCPGYYGHTYSDVGPVTITLTVAWHAQFSLDNRATWTDVDPAPLTGPATRHDLTVVQARGILVQDP